MAPADERGTDETVARWGAMRPYRVVLFACTVVHLAFLVPLPPLMSDPIAPLSFAGAVFHVMITLEHESPAPSIVHFALHSSGSLILAWKALHREDFVLAIQHLFFVLVFYPLLCKSLLRFRKAARAHGRDVTADTVSKAFLLLWIAFFWMSVLSSDSFGCLLWHPFDETVQQELCRHRVLANYIGSFHLFAISFFGLLGADTSWGLGIDLGTIMALDLSWPECIVGLTITITSCIALALFALREVEGDENMFVVSVLWNIFFACWLLAAVTIAMTMDGVRERRARHTRAARRITRQRVHAQSRMSKQANAVVVPFPAGWAWFLSISTVFSYTIPQQLRLWLEYTKLRGTTGAFSNMLCIAHFLMATNDRGRATWRLQLVHWGLHITGLITASIAELYEAESEARQIELVVMSFMEVLVHAYEFWYWFYILQPSLLKWNPKLNSGLSVAIFRWLFERGGLLLSM